MWTKRLQWTNEWHNIRVTGWTSIIWHVPQEHLLPSSRTSSLTTITNQLGKLKEDDGDSFKSGDFLVPELEPAILGHCAVPYINLPRYPAIESGCSETAPPQILFPKYQVKLPKVCKVNRGKVLKISSKYLSTKWENPTSVLFCFYDLLLGHRCFLCSSS